MSHNDMAAVARANEEKPAPTLELQRSEDGSALIPDMRPTMGRPIMAVDVRGSSVVGW